jgi:hypothetical protein
MGIALAPILIAVAGSIGVDLDRLTHHLLLTAVLSVVVGVGFMRLMRTPVIAIGVMVGPVIAFSVRYVLAQNLWIQQPFWIPSGAGAATLWALLLAVATAIGSLLFLSVSGDQPLVAGPLGVAGLMAVGVIGLAAVAPPLLSPTYTIRDTALELEQLLGDQEVAWQYRASGIFLGNHLRYREVLVDADPADIDFIVGMFRPLPATTDGTYEVVREFPLHLGVSHEFLGRGGIDATARLFRRAPGALSR